MMKTNGFSSVEHTPLSPLDRLQSEAQRFSFFYPDQQLQAEQVPPIDDFVAFIGVCMVPAEVSLQFWQDAGNSYIGHKEYAAQGTADKPLSNRFVLCHPPKPLPGGISERSKDRFLHVQHQKISPLQHEQTGPLAEVIEQLRTEHLLRPTYLTVCKDGEMVRQPQVELPGGWGVFRVGHQVVSAAMLSNKLIADSRRTLEGMATSRWSTTAEFIRNQQKAGNWLSLIHETALRAVAQEMPTRAEARELVATKLSLRLVQGETKQVAASIHQEVAHAA